MTIETTIEQYQFHLDSSTPVLVSGWAYLTGNDEHHPIIEVRSGEVILWKGEAMTYRNDLSAAGIGNGQYAFSITPMSKPVKNAISHVDIYIDGHKIQENIPFEMTPVEMSDYRAQLDHITTELVKGWVFKKGNANYRSQVEVRCGDTVIATGLAEEYREDLSEAEIGDGHYGFSLTPRLDLFPSATCECNLFIDGERANLDAFILSADVSEIENAVYKHKFSEEMVDFTQSVEIKMATLKQDIMAMNRSIGQDEFGVNGQLQVALNNIAELSVRVNVIEQVLIKHLSK